MNITEIAVMLTFMGSLDGRIQPDEATAMAWNNVLDSRMDALWASDYVKKHYGKTGDMLIPSSLNKAWSDYSRLKTVNNIDLDSHCGKPGCKCTHRMCYKGWIDSPIPDIPEDVKRDIRRLKDIGGSWVEVLQLARGRTVSQDAINVVEKCVVCRPPVVNP